MVKDKIPAGIKKWDADISYKIFKSVPKDGQHGQMLKAIEFTSHNLLWIGVTLIGLYGSPDATFFKHLLVGIISDIVHVAIIKAYSRRRRPSYRHEKDNGTYQSESEDKPKETSSMIGIDKHSFPSGHASRAIYFATLITRNYLSDGSLVSALMSMVIYAWALLVSISKVINGKNHLLDILAGIVLGKLNYFIQFITGSPINAILWMLINSVLSTDS